MKEQAYHNLADVEQTYWWHRGRLKIIEKQMAAISTNGSGRTILNIGAGTGGTIPTIDKFGRVTNVDTSTVAIKLLEKHGFKAKKFNGRVLPFKDETFDIVLALDVLEHIEDDSGTLEDWWRVLRPGGSMIVTVPAYKWLWSEHDEANMHFRRYSKKRLSTLVSRIYNIQIKKLSYMIVFSLPLIAGYRFFNKLTGALKQENITNPKVNEVKLPNWLNHLFIRLLGVEASFQKKIDFPFGTSLIAVLYKKDH